MKQPQRGCDEYEALSRRSFLTKAGTTALAATLPAWMPRVTFAQPGSTRDVLVFIYMRGGADGLSMVIPYNEAPYYDKRPTLAIPAPSSASPKKGIDLDGQFAFPSVFAPLKDAYTSGHLLVIPASGLPMASRSHFLHQHLSESGDPDDPHLTTGWLGRHIKSVSPMGPFSLARGMCVDNAMPFSLVGGPKTVPMGVSATPSNEALDYLNKVYNQTVEPIRTYGTDIAGAVKLIKTVNLGTYVPSGGAVYPNTVFGKAMKGSAAMIKANIGVEVIQADFGVWDTHANQGAIGGYLEAHMSEFAKAVGAFHADIFSSTSTNVTLLAISEFGRTLRENSDKGTDHGHGGVTFVMGSHISGGRVLKNKWPGLQPAKLYQGQDVEVAVDHRDIMAEIVKNRLGNPHLDEVFPEFTPTFQGITF